MSDEHSAFRPVPRTGVIYVTTEAQKRGFSPSDPDWCNLGQGQPETGELPGAPARIRHVDVALDDQDYAPIAGLWELRETIASLYNALYRRGMRSQYSAENVCVSGGGRAALTRAAASLGHVNLGHFLPDYTAYEELLDIFKAFTSIPILLEGDRGYAFGAEELRREILGRGLSAILMSNPCNPTGKLVQGESGIAECRIEQPGRAVGEDELHRLGGVSLEVGLEEGQLGRRQIVGAAVVQNGKVRRPVVKAVVRGMGGKFTKQLFGAFRPDVVIAGCEIEPIAGIWRHDPLPRAPLGFGRGIVAAFDRVADTDDESRILGCCLAPHLLVDARLGFAGAVAQDHEAERVRRGSGQRSEGQRECRIPNQESPISHHAFATVSRRR